MHKKAFSTFFVNLLLKNSTNKAEDFVHSYAGGVKYLHENFKPMFNKCLSYSMNMREC